MLTHTSLVGVELACGGFKLFYSTWYHKKKDKGLGGVFIGEMERIKVYVLDGTVLVVVSVGEEGAKETSFKVKAGVWTKAYEVYLN